jgi:hypothetical protein
MNEEKVIVLRLRFTRTRALLALSFLFLCWHPRPLDSETLTLTTYYPAPYGGYVSILTTGNTYLARDTGNVGIGTATPAVKLDINGNGWARGQFQWGASKASLTSDQGGSIEVGGAGTPYVDFSQNTGQDYSARLWLPIAGQLQAVGDFSVTGNIVGSSTNRIMNYCSEVGFGGGTSWCPPGTRVMAQYGTGRSYAGLLFLGNSALEAGSGWVPHYDQGTSGTMLCCRIQ